MKTTSKRWFKPIKGKFSESTWSSARASGPAEITMAGTVWTLSRKLQRCVRDGKRLVTDGPFAETKEQLGGYYLVEAKAIAIAARIPAARMGSIEVRPILPTNVPA
jgi:hypothetical protein